MSTVLGILFLIVVVPYLASRVGHARAAAWAGPRTPGMRGRASSSAGRPRAAGTGRAAFRSAGAAVLHPGTRHIRAQAKADVRRAWQETFAADWLEQRRHEREHEMPAAGGTATAAPPKPTVAQRLRLKPFTPPGPASAGGNGNGGGQPNGVPVTPAVPAPYACRCGATYSAPQDLVRCRQSHAANSTPPQAASPGSTNGGTDMAAGTSTASAEKLIEGINEIHAHAATGGINAKREAVKAVHEGFVRFGAMLAMLARQMSEPGQNYGHEITEPLAQAGTHAQAGAMSASESDAALSTLINMTVGELATSPRRAPHHEELSETGAR